MTYAETQEYLFSLRTLGSKFGLERMQRFYDAAGRPANAVPVIHVAGTNGKGSVCAMVEAIARACGLRTGLFTSPHLLRLGERVQVDREALSQEQIVAYASELKPLCERLCAGDMRDHPTFFELMTVIALCHFERRQCGIAILETGLGGRLDSTNIVSPVVTAITSIGLDHQEILGESLEQIAAEKAGIIKPGVPLVLGDVPPQAEAVILARAQALGAPVLRVRDYFLLLDSAAALNAPSVALSGAKPEYPQTSLSGDFQRRNAAAALLIWEQFCRSSGTAFNREAALAALRQVSWAGRWQCLTLAGGRELILDASHNEEGSRALEDNLHHYAQSTGYQPPLIVTGVLGMTRAEPLFRVIARYARAITLVEVHQPRACAPQQLLGAVPADFAGEVFTAQVSELFPGGETLGGVLADERFAGVPVIVTGSIYLIGEVLSQICNEHSQEAIRLQDKIVSAGALAPR